MPGIENMAFKAEEIEAGDVQYTFTMGKFPGHDATVVGVAWKKTFNNDQFLANWPLCSKTPSRDAKDLIMTLSKNYPVLST